MKQREIARRYVGRKLGEYYSQPANCVVGRSSGVDNSNLSWLLGEGHWRRVFKKLYEEREGHWLTPVELFRPHYSRILADFCSFTLNADTSNIEIVELGGGRGTNANLILSYLQEHKPELYGGLTYTLVDSSPTLHRFQQDALANGPHGDKIRFELKDLMDVAEETVELLPKSNALTVVLGMEILDNLPHDKIRASSLKRIEQAEVKSLSNGGQEEVFVPLEDPLLARVIKNVPSYVQAYPCWIPTVACGVLSHIQKQRPNLSIVLADFDWLPAPDLKQSDEDLRLSTWAEGEPIVTDMKGVDHECYLSSPKHCDILFPTEFEKLASFIKRTSKRDILVQVEKQAEFLERYGPEHVRTTKSWLTGHTPLLHDFTNCSVLTATTISKSPDQ